MPAKCKERERIASSGNPDVPSLPVGAIRGYLCFRCFGPATNILKCGGCKRAYYCSKACQKLDWGLIHKNHCKIFKTINEVEEQQYQSTRTWKEYSEYLLQTVRIIRNAAPRDEALRYTVQAQAYCSSCRRTAVQLTNRNIALKRCPTCRLVFTCSECPSSSTTHPASVCATYKNYGEIENFRTAFFEDTGKASPITCTQFPRNTRKLLSECGNWHDYYVHVSDKPQIKGVIRPDFGGLVEGSTAGEVEGRRMRMFLLCATDNLSMPLTVVSALEDIACDAENINIHLVGATGRELVAMGNFEEILHLIPSVRSLHITAIGPSLMAGSDSPLIPKTSVDCCPACKADGRTRSIAVYKGLYHDYAKIAEFEKPDLVVLFNSGWADGDDSVTDWAPTIEFLIGEDVPALFTTYNRQEAEHEEERMKAFGARFLVGVGENRWRGLMPTPEFIDEEYGVWYNNAFRYVVKGKEG
ncbi:hypothetical protein P280DRAFT_471615 [Massarina eburnea CBS 473.64]|uniref:MYND-type domain-containing protein n=1 Tax=Massarina eburnea CBS 473.64 TaxID=1395130 RepID=A0A6A6RUL7_9PLEO|nr:hypothetical protein P280DRAFT_471615 [Massarina eburnea CBS 473.64]